MDVALYVGLVVACLVIGGLGFFLARIVQRKGRDHSLYSMARSGKSTTLSLSLSIEFTRSMMYTHALCVHVRVYA